MRKLIISTKHKREVLDITDKVQGVLDSLEGNNGVCCIFVKHTTASITTADLDPGTDLDFLDVLDKLIPNIKFRHEHKPEHAPDHILASIIGPSVCVPFADKQLILGTWQRIVLLEFDGPREREILISL